MSIRRLVTTLAAAAIVIAMAVRLHAISPTVMMFYGGTLPKPVFVSGADAAAFGDVLRQATVTVKELGDRPFVNVALFWGPENNPALNGRSMSELTPQMAWQHGRLYLPAAGRPAVLLATQMRKGTQPVPIPSAGEAFTGGGPVPDDALPVLKRLGLSAASGAGRVGSAPR